MSHQWVVDQSTFHWKTALRSNLESSKTAIMKPHLERKKNTKKEKEKIQAVSYTHLTLPTMAVV